jgi:hypothetical protein
VHRQNVIDQPKKAIMAVLQMGIAGGEHPPADGAGKIRRLHGNNANGGFAPTPDLAARGDSILGSAGSQLQHGTSAGTRSAAAFV